jgi:N-acetyl-1-D-myo-inositol-2-amino-2-deoxy-alpha-D-glucopyranoside deacetylase
VLDHPDGDLRWAHVPELHAEIAMTIRRLAAAAVITFDQDGLYWHPDHIGVHERTTTAVASLGDQAPALYYVTMPRGMMRAVVDAATARGWTPPPKGFWSLVPDAFGLHAEPPTIAVDVEAWVGRKMSALRAHGTQLGEGDPFSCLDEAAARRWLRVEHFRRAPGGASQRLLETIGGRP